MLRIIMGLYLTLAITLTLLLAVDEAPILPFAGPTPGCAIEWLFADVGT
jgi:hypothetical protein